MFHQASTESNPGAATPAQDHSLVILSQDKHRKLPAHWISLDNQSIEDAFHNAALLQNIRITMCKWISIAMLGSQPTT